MVGLAHHDQHAARSVLGYDLPVHHKAFRNLCKTRSQIISRGTGRIKRYAHEKPVRTAIIELLRV